MTLRSVVLGLLGAALLAGVGYINNQVLRLTALVGNHLPISVFGLLIVVAIGINPALHLLRRGWGVRPSELAVAMGLMLVACSVPGGGLMGTFVPVTVMPIEYNQTLSGWRKTGMLEYVHPALLPADGRYDKEVMGEIFSGAQRDGKTIALGDVPWGKWRRTLVTWTSIILLTGVASISLGLIVHRQWSLHERLRYPIADFARSVMEWSQGSGRGASGSEGLLQGPDAPVRGPSRGGGLNRLFWIGLAVVLSVRIVNGIQQWYPSSVDIPLTMDLSAIGQKWPGIAKIPFSNVMLRPRIFPTVVAFTFFLASDVGFTLGITQTVYTLIAALLIAKGVDISHDYMAGGPRSWQFFGSYVGFALLTVYTGRRYYWGALKQACVGRRGEGRSRIPAYAVWGFRVFLLSTGALVVVLCSLEIQWPVAILTVAFIMTLYLVIARITVESGLFFNHAGWMCAGVFGGLFGRDILGPKAIIMVGLVSTMLSLNPRECLLPFFVNALKICEGFRVKVGRMGLGAVGAFVLALAVAFPVVLWANYNYGLPQQNRWILNIPRRIFEPAEHVVTNLSADGRLGAVDEMSGWERLTSMKPEPKFIWGAGLGVALVLVCSALRLRFAWWPLHPIIFLVWGMWPIQHFGFSFLLGWTIKMGVTKLVGGYRYHQLKPLMIGVVAGDLLGGLVFMAVGAIYFAVTGLIPKSYTIFP